MKAIFVNQSRLVRYADAIVQGYKPIETRNKNMLAACVGERIAIICTMAGKAPMIIGYVTITKALFKSTGWLDEHRNLTLIPEGSKYDSKSFGKWCYFLADPETCEPYPLPANTIRHGRSWCEF